jgi:hypothetical protein
MHGANNIWESAIYHDHTRCIVTSYTAKPGQPSSEHCPNALFRGNSTMYIKANRVTVNARKTDHNDVCGLGVSRFARSYHTHAYTYT